jgi:hypothetical protein
MVVPMIPATIDTGLRGWLGRLLISRDGATIRECKRIIDEQKRREQLAIARHMRRLERGRGYEG